MKSRAMFASKVAMSDAYLGMTLESQLAYVLLRFEADVVGRILGARRILRGYGFADDVLDELAESGFLIQVGGEWFDRHTWRHDKFSTRVSQRAENDEAISSGLLAFEGAPFKSSYRATPERRQGDAIATTERRAMQCNTPAPAPAPAPVPAPAPAPSFSGKADEGIEDEAVHPCTCRQCGSTSATYALTDSGTIITCPTCGQYQYTTK